MLKINDQKKILAFIFFLVIFCFIIIYYNKLNNFIVICEYKSSEITEIINFTYENDIIINKINKVKIYLTFEKSDNIILQYYLTNLQNYTNDCEIKYLNQTEKIFILYKFILFLSIFLILLYEKKKNNRNHIS